LNPFHPEILEYIQMSVYGLLIGLKFTFGDRENLASPFIFLLKTAEVKVQGLGGIRFQRARASSWH
jgi:hypothetical protein